MMVNLTNASKWADWRYQWISAFAIIAVVWLSAGRVPTPFQPFPLHFFVLYYLVDGLAYFILPALYLVSLKLVRSASEWFYLVTISVLILGLNVSYLILSVEYGLTYQGKEHVFIVIGLNIAFILGAGSLLVYSFIRKNEALKFAAHFLLFIGLAYCFFPYFGELP